MPQAQVYARTPKGTLETRNRASALPADLAPVLHAVDGRATTQALAAALKRESAAVAAALEALEQGGYVEPAGTAPPPDDLDFTSPATLSRLEALAQSRARAEQAALARVAQVRRDAAAATGPVEAQAHARAESEAQARAHAEAHARAMVEAQLKATNAALARAQALARDEAQARARVTADLQAREAAQAQARAEAASRARAEAEREMRTELARLREEAQEAIAAADARAAAEREAREAAEARIASELEAQRRAHAAARAATVARMEEERAAREAAEWRVQAELEARERHQAAVAASAEASVRVRVAEELRAREDAERAEDARQRAEAARRARYAAAAQAATPEAPPAVKRKPTDRKLVLSVAGAALVVAAVVAAFAVPRVPLDAYVPDVEEALSASLRQPVRVGRMHYRLVPAPELVLEGLRIGASYGTRVERMLVGAWPWELANDTPRAATVVVSGVAVDAEGVAGLLALLDERAQAARVRRIRFEAARLPLHEIELAVSSASVEYDSDGRVRRIALASGGANFEAAPLGGAAWRVGLEARAWRPNVGPAVRFDTVTMKGVVADRRLRSASMEATLGEGRMTATIAADWRAGLRAEGRFQLAQASLESVLAAGTSHFSGRGTLSAEGRYALQGATLAALFEAPRVTASFAVENGELANVDVVRALQQTSSQGVQGGLTRFDRLEGVLEVVDDRYRYRNLQLASGPMSATGEVEVGPGQRLAGRVSAGVSSGSRTAIRGMLAVRGTVVHPVLRP